MIQGRKRRFAIKSSKGIIPKFLKWFYKLRFCEYCEIDLPLRYQDSIRNPLVFVGARLRRLLRGNLEKEVVVDRALLEAMINSIECIEHLLKKEK